MLALNLAKCKCQTIQMYFYTMLDTLLIAYIYSKSPAFDRAIGKVVWLTRLQERHSEQECSSHPDRHHTTNVDLKFWKSRYPVIKQLGYDTSEHLGAHCIVKLIPVIVTENHICPVLDSIHCYQTKTF